MLNYVHMLLLNDKDIHICKIVWLKKTLITTFKSTKRHVFLLIG